MKFFENILGSLFGGHKTTPANGSNGIFGLLQPLFQLLLGFIGL